MATFHAWRTTPLRGLADGSVVAGRLQGKQTVAIADLDNASDVRPMSLDFELLGPGDVVRLAPGSISRRFPAPGSVDAEETKAALVEFSRADLLDLPWRYSPEVERTFDTGRGVRPWIVLVVGTDDELTIASGGDARLSPALQQKHPLAGSWRWAHVHEVDGTTVSRILCPRDLAPLTRYTACLVPAFVVDAGGELADAWPRNGEDVRVACFDHWSFTTGPDGDFAQLAAMLRATTAAALGESFGTASVRCDRRGAGSPARADLAAAGALKRPAATAFSAAPAWIAAQTSSLIERIATPDGRWVLTVPRYDDTFTTPGAPIANDGWSGDLASDPRHRGAAGLGAWAAIAWQERIADAAFTKAGDLAIARDRINAVAFGVEASRALWRRRMPEDAVERLAILAPVLGRIPAQEGGTVLDRLAGRTPLFARALWSSAARRALRPGPARTVLCQPGAAKFAAILRHAAECPVPRRDADTIDLDRRIDDAARRAAIEEAIRAAGSRDPALADEVIDKLLADGATPSAERLASLLAVLDPGGREPPDRDRVRRALDARESHEAFDASALATTFAKLRELPRREERCRPVSVDALGRRIANAVDPTVAKPLVVDRVLGTLQGIGDIGPVEIEPELDLPLWRFLADASPDWLLPGVGDLPEHRVVALATNPPFVEALLVGANHQAVGELRWRNVPLASRASPLRKFWHRRGGEFDINSIRNWPAATPLGGAALQPADIGIEAVVVFRTKLFRRYPATVVYLYEADTSWTLPPDNEDLDPTRKRLPTFTGTIGDDVTFFGFPVQPSALAKHWVVLEEPVGGYRFRTEKVSALQSGLPEGDPATLLGQIGNNAAVYAHTTFAPPVRVMIGKLMETA